LQIETSATCLGSLAAQGLESDSGSEIIGEVVSVYPSSLYIKTTNRELVFVTTRDLRSPISVNLDSGTALSRIVRPQDSVSLTENGIRLGASLSINLSRATLWSEQTTPPAHQLAITRSTLNLTALILMIVDHKLSVLDDAGIAHAGASKFMSDGLLPFLESNDVSTFLNAAQRIVGLGTGFTPSGDDLLGGFLATYNRFTRVTGRQAINLSFDALESRTHWISAKLLDYMQRRILDEQMNRLIESSASLGDDTFILAVQPLMPRGHTSGIDILVGVLLALGFVHDIVRKDNMTRVIVKNLHLFM
jgi:hypothetical protein